MNQNCGTAELAPATVSAATRIAGAGHARSGLGVKADVAATRGLSPDVRPGRSAHGTRLSGLPALTLLASLIVSLLAASAAPTPLYAIYQQRWGFSPVTTTIVFGVYAVAVLGSLLTFGRLSDYAGRRPVLLAALAVQVVSLIVFAIAGGVGDLLIARVIQGLATGAALGAIGAGMLDVDRERGALANALSPGLGTSSGALASALLVRYQVAASAAAFRPVVKAAGPRPRLEGPLLLLDVLTQDRYGRPADRPGEVGRGPQAVRPPVMAREAGELLPHPPGRHALEGVDQPRQGDLGREVHQQVNVVRLAVELAELALEAGAHVPHDLLQPLKVASGEHWVPVLRDEDQVRVEHEDTVPASAYVRVFGHEANYSEERAAPVLLPPLPRRLPARGAGQGVRLRASRVQRRARGEAGGARGRRAAR